MSDLIKNTNFLKDNHFQEWLKVRQETENEVSDSHPIKCVCGRLMTGFHESVCGKFQALVMKKTAKKMEHLLPKI